MASSLEKLHYYRFPESMLPESSPIAFQRRFIPHFIKDSIQNSHYNEDKM
ncbi:MAG: hypothetical protein JSC188_000622 [Candidatus Tokpelaia sp. JSC188]|nr:MAG: hypothetical protein JSC188_000622 [Candidatus Tokpelaia sp. JSC188]